MCSCCCGCYCSATGPADRAHKLKKGFCINVNANGNENGNGNTKEKPVRRMQLKAKRNPKTKIQNLTKIDEIFEAAAIFVAVTPAHKLLA